MSLDREAVLGHNDVSQCYQTAQSMGSTVGISRQSVWLINLFKELGLKIPPLPIYEDNQAVRRILLNSQYRERFRHRMNVIHCIRDYIKENFIRIVCCPTRTMIADIGTKVHKAHIWARLMEMIFPKEYHEVTL